MREQVYLFELDSVRKTDEEIIKGQTALYDEIVTNGNVVVLTYNQLVDSRGFFSLLDDKDYRESLLKLFENGAIRISQFGDVRSLSQYLINSVDSEKKFIYSALPVKFSQKHIRALIKRSLMYSDLSELYEYYSGKRSDEDLVELFEEVEEDKTVHESSLFTGKQYKVVLKDMRNILENIYWLLSTVLDLSVMHNIYIHPKDPEEYKEMKLHNIIKIVSELDLKDNTIWDNAVSVIKGLKAFSNNNDNRSVYLREIKEQYEKDNDKNNIDIYQYAEAIISLCYNYVCEISICNISKHYNLRELNKDYLGEKITFKEDFRHRLQQYWNNGKDADKRYLADEVIYFEEFVNNNRIPKFETAVRCTEYVSYKNKGLGDCIYRYEYRLKEKIKRQKAEVLKAMFMKIILVIVCFIVVVGIEMLFDYCKDVFVDYLPFLPVFGTVLFLMISEVLTSVISSIFPSFMSLSEALGCIGELIRDSAGILFRKSKNYFNKCVNSKMDIEDKNKEIVIDYILPERLKRYQKFKKDIRNSEVFKNSEIYNLVDINNSISKKEIIKQEERFNCHYGMVYNSDYNIMLVDPVSSGGKIFPYERILPSGDDGGVVMLTIYKDKFILLRQYRHAPRDEQYSFPRGFSEKGYTVLENVCRELKEEIGADIKKEPEFLGYVIPDSGLTSRKVSVYMVEIESYKFDTTIHEGIESIEQIPIKCMQDWIDSGKINDGFTLSAYALYVSKNNMVK